MYLSQDILTGKSGLTMQNMTGQRGHESCLIRNVAKHTKNNKHMVIVNEPTSVMQDTHRS